MKSIILYGNSVFLSSLAATLECVDGLKVISLDSAAGLIDLQQVQLVFIDLSETRAEDVLSLVRIHPALTVAGIDPAANTLTVLAGHSYMVRTVQDVAQWATGQCDPDASR